MGASVGRDLDSPEPDTDTSSWLQTQHSTQLSPSATLVAWKYIYVFVNVFKKGWKYT